MISLVILYAFAHESHAKIIRLKEGAWVAVAKKWKIPSKKPKRKWNLFRLRTGEEDARIHGAVLELHGDREAVIEGCLGVYDYSDTYLKLRLPKGSVILFGKEFELTAFEEERISIKGKISSLEFGM